MVFLVFSIAAFIAVTLFVPKNLTKYELHAVAIFSILLGFSIDIIFDLKYNLYGYFSPGVQFAGFLPILFLFPTSGILFMNFYPFGLKLKYKLLYVFCWTVFCLFFEYLSIMVGYFYHNGWKYSYSAIAYPLLLSLHLLHLRLFRSYYN